MTESSDSEASAAKFGLAATKSGKLRFIWYTLTNHLGTAYIIINNMGNENFLFVKIGMSYCFCFVMKKLSEFT